jgi:hypothetical protein
MPPRNNRAALRRSAETAEREARRVAESRAQTAIRTIANNMRKNAIKRKRVAATAVRSRSQNAAALARTHAGRAKEARAALVRNMRYGPRANISLLKSIIGNFHNGPSLAAARHAYNTQNPFNLPELRFTPYPRNVANRLKNYYIRQELYTRNMQQALQAQQQANQLAEQARAMSVRAATALSNLHRRKNSTAYR